MDCTRNKIKEELINYYKSLGLEVKTTTKALGHQGFFRVNRIDISKNIKKERIVPTLLHEFAHYVVYKINPICKDLTQIFQTNDDEIYNELIEVTNFVDKNSTLEKLVYQKKTIQSLIQEHESIIKNNYPHFRRSECFKPFDKYSKKSDCKYLLKHDAVRVLHWFNYKTYSVINLEQDFPDMPTEFMSYLRLKSCQRKQASISRKMNKLNKYYTQPTELFARYIEGLYMDINEIKCIAPRTTMIFKDLLSKNYYPMLSKVLSIVNIEL